MTDFDPGEGWSEVTRQPKAHYVAEHWLDTERDVWRSRFWVRDAPVPELPTEPYTVIRVAWNDRRRWAEVLTLVGDRWGEYTADDLSRNITGFKVLAEPHIVRTYLMEEQRQALRRETVRAVLARVRSAGGTPWGTLDDIASEFGVTP